ncbi:MAG: hypothetical protein IPK83_01650 [Planctomycetes bacterium]|nr:hypothetical protein [Planctomycetota bacterium]
MTQSLSMRPAVEGIEPTFIESFTRDGYQWRIAGDHAENIRNAPFDWFNLAPCPAATLIKRNSGRDVWRVKCGDREYFAKLYHPRDTFVKLKALIRGSTAACEWQVGLYAASHGIAAVKPVATATRGFRGVGGPALLITEAVPEVEPLSDYWLRVRDDRHRANLLAESLARLIARAHQCGFRHGDMHPGNILVRKAGRTGEALFVDLHNVRMGRSVPMNEVVANLAQLHQWFRRHSTLSRRRRFLELYVRYRDRFAQASPFARNFRISAREMIERVAVRADMHSNRLWAKPRPPHLSQRNLFHPHSPRRRLARPRPAAKQAPRHHGPGRAAKIQARQLGGMAALADRMGEPGQTHAPEGLPHSNHLQGRLADRSAGDGHCQASAGAEFRQAHRPALRPFPKHACLASGQSPAQS